MNVTSDPGYLPLDEGLNLAYSVGLCVHLKRSRKYVGHPENKPIRYQGMASVLEIWNLNGAQLTTVNAAVGWTFYLNQRLRRLKAPKVCLLIEAAKRQV